MKNNIIILCAAFVLFCAFISRHHTKSDIHGMIDPPEGASKVWAISGTDSVAAVPVSGGFSIPVKPGNWSVVVVAIKPYKNALVSNISVVEGESADAGTIKLQPE